MDILMKKKIFYNFYLHEFLNLLTFLNHNYNLQHTITNRKAYLEILIFKFLLLHK